MGYGNYSIRFKKQGQQVAMMAHYLQCAVWLHSCDLVYFGACHCVGKRDSVLTDGDETDGDETDGHPEKSKIKSKSHTRPDGRYVHTYLNVYMRDSLM